MKSQIRVLVVFGVILINLYLIDMFTIKNNLGGGNGNPALVFILLLLSFLAYFSYLFLKWIIQNITAWLSRISIIFTSITILVLGFNHQKRLYIDLKGHLVELSLQKKGEIHMDYIESITNGLTIYTNTIYFNYVTLAMFLSLICIIGVFLTIIKSKNTFVA